MTHATHVMPAKRRPTTHQPIEVASIPEALLTLRTVCAITGMGRTQLLDLVKSGAFPAPAVRRPKFVRWRAADVTTWLQQQNAGSKEKAA